MDLNIGGDAKHVSDVVGCAIEDARHYLEQFNGDPVRTINAVISLGDDSAWWAHPWNFGIDRGALDRGDDESLENEENCSHDADSVRDTDFANFSIQSGDVTESVSN